jgi:quercetin dioxygenase-like cupin family protein
MNVHDDLPKIGVPTLGVHGTEDRSLPIEAIADRLPDLIEGRPPRPRVARPRQHRLDPPDEVNRALLGSSAGQPLSTRLAVVEWRVRAGDQPPIHTHTREDETLYVVEGAITAYVGDEKIEVEAGSYAALPKNVPHGFTVRSEHVRLLVTVEPAGAEYFFVPRDDLRRRPGRVRPHHSRASPGDVTQLAGMRRRSRNSAATAFAFRQAEAKAIRIVASDPSEFPVRARHMGPSASRRRAPWPRRTQVPDGSNAGDVFATRMRDQSCPIVRADSSITASC